MSVEEAVKSVLAKNPLLMVHPGDSRLVGSVYAGPSNSVSHMAEMVAYRGRNQVASNNTRFGSVCNFQISSSDIVDDFSLSATITLPAATVINQRGWLFDFIENIQFTASNSSIQSQTIDGDICKQWMLLTCRDIAQRDALLLAAGDLVATGQTASACIPVSYLLQSALGASQGYGLDLSTLAGPLQFSIKLRAASAVVEGTVAGIANVPTFDRLVMVNTNTQFVDNQFGVRNALSKDNSLVYAIPAKYISDVQSVETISPGTAYTMNVNSCPAAGLIGILVFIQSRAWLGNGSTEDIYKCPADITQLKLSFGGVDLFNANTPEEIASFYRYCMDGDDLRVNYAHAVDGAAAATTYTGLVTRQLISRIGWIPLAKDTRMALEREIENAPQYGGSTLSLTFTVAADAALKENDNSTPFRRTASTRTAQSTSFNVKLGYVCNALMEVQNSVASMLL